MSDEFVEITPNEARDILVERLMEYKKFKNASKAMHARFVTEGRMHARPFGPDRIFFQRMPDYLEGVTLDALALLCAQAFARRDVFLLEAEHIAAKPIPVEIHVRAIHQRIVNSKKIKFSDLVNEDTPKPVLVATFLAVLELYKRSMVKIVQKKPFGDIDISYIEGSGELSFDGENAISSVLDGEATTADMPDKLPVTLREDQPTQHEDTDRVRENTHEETNDGKGAV